ncbi:STAS domain-containing protein [Candidatus Magnetomonas plexicatena]|uniref:STAS domain-containing protein n=1 Tax=Candidatus Magnetomonas plexicatena TaxID=2552947 RepID=UPI0011051787|nr:STAS domain-containing protein [Nitrospirales bacterium LBB_01]
MKFDTKKDKEGGLVFDFKKHNEALVITVSGSMDSQNAPEFAKIIDEKLNAGESVFIVNLNSLTHLSSAGLRNIVIVLKKLAANSKKIFFVSSNEDVNRIFKMAGLYNSLVKIFDSEEAAYSACK